VVLIGNSRNSFVTIPLSLFLQHKIGNRSKTAERRDCRQCRLISSWCISLIRWCWLLTVHIAWYR